MERSRFAVGIEPNIFRPHACKKFVDIDAEKILRPGIDAQIHSFGAMVDDFRDPTFAAMLSIGRDEMNGPEKYGHVKPRLPGSRARAALRHAGGEQESRECALRPA